ncbi:hypothetical protein HZA44_01005, partial [Candidatus Peregrinibacteria bacterium]|nr:hypothetical protein [Candidatus Peregrinibacteria bacterium]
LSVLNNSNTPQSSIIDLETSLDRLISFFVKYPHVFLTEDDVRCHLVAELLRNSKFSQIVDTEDSEKSINIHSEVRWYGESRNLRYRSDVVVLDTSDLRVTDTTFKLPSKGFGFNNFFAIIEIKLRRNIKKSDSTFINEINADFEKLKKIHFETNTYNKHKANYYLLCFDKGVNLCRRLPLDSQNPNIKIMYASMSPKIAP